MADAGRGKSGFIAAVNSRAFSVCPCEARLRLPEIRALGRSAVAALHAELALDPKPGLVSFVDSGSHDDMDAATFMRSLFALRSYFPAVAEAGAGGADLHALEQLGIDAERRMLRATGGVNTHRGAIFLLGLLCASAGRCLADGRALTASGIRETLIDAWGDSLAERAAQRRSATSHGAEAARRYRLRSISDEAAAGFPTLFDHALPALRAAREAGWDERAARVQTLFVAIAVLDDTTLAHRGGAAGLRWAQRGAQRFLDAGGAGAPDWLARVRQLHGQLVALRLSPGGAADTLAAAWWLARVTDRGHCPPG